jgi:hypothetical protein
MNSAVNRILAKYLKLPTAGAVVKEFSAFVSFRYHQFARRPYFGPYMASRQLSPTRASFMRQLMQKICSERGSLLMLEIGSWAGENAILWAEVAKQTLAMKHRQPPSIMVDPWTPYNIFEWESPPRTHEKSPYQGKDLLPFPP